MISIFASVIPQSRSTSPKIAIETIPLDLGHLTLV